LSLLRIRKCGVVLQKSKRAAPGTRANESGDLGDVARDGVVSKADIGHVNVY
jgi:hypothetical protein